MDSPRPIDAQQPSSGDEFVSRLMQLLHTDVSADDMDEFLTAADEVSRDFGETMAALSRAKDEDTADEAAKAAYLEFVTQVYPRVAPLIDELNKKLLAVPDYQPPPELVTTWNAMQDDVALYSADNIELLAQEAAYGQEFGEITGSLRIDLDGRQLSYSEAVALLEETDRDLRERVYRALHAARAVHRPRLDELFSNLLVLRQQVARNAGSRTYRDHVWRELHRHDYTPDDTLTMHASVEAEVVPRLRQLTAKRAARLGLDALKPWDLDVDALGRAPLAPFESVDQLVSGMKRMLGALDPELAQQFELLDGGWMNLEPSPNKVPGLGYQSYFPRSRRPYIYYSVVGTNDDLLTMIHEAGHAFHTIRTQDAWPLTSHMSSRAEMNELASQGLELLTLPYLTTERGGFYDAADARRAQASLLVRALQLLVAASRYDALQHWLYDRPVDAPPPTIAEIDAQWLEISERFDVGIDYETVEDTRRKSWQIVHLFLMPFYYIEYAIAYLGALQLWERVLEDPARALAGYKAALTLGSTRPLDELYRAAGIEFTFDRDTIARLSELVMRELGDEV
jgi:oligoendopeptidase F